MNPPDRSAGVNSVRHAAATGAVAGLVGGFAFGGVMMHLGTLPSMRLLLLAGSPILAFMVHMGIAAVIGAGFGVVARWFDSEPGETVSLGIAYGALWWYVGPLTVLPLLLGAKPAWELQVAQERFPDLLGHVLYGATTGLAFAVIRPHADRAGPPRRLTVGGLLRGVAAGMLAAWVVAATASDDLGIQVLEEVATQRTSLTPVTAAVMVGPLIGLFYTLLYVRPAAGAGVTLVRGQAYGFLLWVAGGLTVAPLIQGNGLAWTVDEVRGGFPALPGFVLLGVLIALLHRWLGTLGRALQPDGARSREGRTRVGTGGFAAVGRDVLAGSIGGLLFTGVMAKTGFMATVARLVGSSSTVAGIAVHLVISIGVGISYGQLFRHQSRDLGTGLSWGLAYGFFWWIVGPLTVLPMMLGGAPQWSATAAASAFDSLIGHLVFGAGLGLAFHLLETRFGALPPSPRPQAETGPAALTDESMLATAPPLLAVIIVMIVMVPVVLATAPS